MTKVSKAMQALRRKLGLGQAAFAKKLGASRPALSAWETGTTPVPSEVLIRLGKLASDDGARWWFWKQAGLDEKTMLRLAEKVFRERGGAPATEGEVIRVPPHSETGEVSEGPPLALPVQCVPNPDSTRYLVLHKDSISPTVYGELDPALHGLAVGDIVVFDESEKNAKDLLGDIVLAEFEDYKPPSNVFFLGLLHFRLQAPSTSLWEVALWPPGWATGFEIGESKAPRDAKATFEEARANIRLYDRWRIRGRVICWLRPPREGSNKA
jgi:transcriptional regulator with XRE-family HTH domain